MINSLNIQLFDFLHSFAWRDPVFDALVVLGAKVLPYAVITYTAILMYRRLMQDAPNGKPFYYLGRVIREFVWVFGTASIAWAASLFMKFYFSAPRPFLKEEILPLFAWGGFNSFPSGHATVFAALTVAMFLYHRTRGYYFLLAAIVIGLCRVVAGVHYPVDIFVGYLLGASIAYIIVDIIRPELRKIW